MYAHKHDILRRVNILASYVERGTSTKINVGTRGGALVLTKPTKFYAWKRPEPKSVWEPDLSVSLETLPSFLSVGLVYFLFGFLVVSFTALSIIFLQSVCLFAYSGHSLAAKNIRHLVNFE